MLLMGEINGDREPAELHTMTSMTCCDDSAFTRSARRALSHSFSTSLEAVML